MRLGAVLLASGLSIRFGGNKLLATVCGRPMVDYAMEAMQALIPARLAVVTADEQVAHMARQRGMEVILNEAPHMGQAHSIALGAMAMADMEAVLLLAGDQPLLTGASLHLLVQRFSCGKKGIACLQDETHMGNPAVFAARYISELTALTGDKGAKAILRAHEDELLVVPCLHAQELMDADTPQALAAIAAHMACETSTKSRSVL